MLRRFDTSRNCTQNNEPGCVIIQALQEGTLDEARWNSYQKLMAENEYSQNPDEYLVAKKNKFKQIAMLNMANSKH